MADLVARMRKQEMLKKNLVGKSEVRRPFGRPDRRKEDNIKVDRGEIVLRDWTQLYRVN